MVSTSQKHLLVWSFHKLGQKSQLNKVTWRSRLTPRANERNFPACEPLFGRPSGCARGLDAHWRRGVDWLGRTVTGRRDARAWQWCCEEGCDVTMRMARWLAGGRARTRVRRVSHLALAILMERLTRSTWGSDARRTGGERTARLTAAAGMRQIGLKVRWAHGYWISPFYFYFFLFRLFRRVFFFPISFGQSVAFVFHCGDAWIFPTYWGDDFRVKKEFFEEFLPQVWFFFLLFACLFLIYQGWHLEGIFQINCAITRDSVWRGYFCLLSLR